MFKSRTIELHIYTSRNMATFTLDLFLLFSGFLVMCNIFFSASAVPPPPDIIFLNCGAHSKTTSKDGREWDTDSLPKFLLSPDTLNTSTYASASSEQSPSVEQIPYSTARIFRSKFTYTFPVSEAGQKFLRLYFYPTTYPNDLDMTKSFFSVHTPNHTLLSNFSASLNLQQGDLFTLVKEYVIVVDQRRILEVTFTPNPNSYAFVNGIEVVPIPAKLYIRGNDDSGHGTPLVGFKIDFTIDDSMALEKLYRLNVGSSYISPTDDTGMFRSWDGDEEHVFGGSPESEIYSKISINYTLDTPNYTAPEIVYSSARTLPKESFGSNLTWFFQVDSGFHYLLRLHFCEILKQITSPNRRVFSIFINNQTAEQDADVFYWTGGRGIPVYKDYIVIVSNNSDGSKNKPDLWLAMQPYTKHHPTAKNVILNGLEIFKLSQSGGNLASPNPEPKSLPPENKKLPGIKKGGASHFPLVGACIGGSLGAILLFLLFGGFLSLRRKRGNFQDVESKSMWNSLRYDKSKSTNTNISSLPSVRSRKFSLEEIKLATSNFDDNFVIGAGGFGNVYKGYLENGTCTVAIKRLNQSSRQGELEFQTEIKMLSNLRHIHLVPLIGYCDDGDEMILVYEYMVNGTLRSHLYRGDNPSLSWKQRLQICIGAARGLHYLHEGAERMIIHRDVKSTNILLDEKMVAKVSDFGLSKLGPSDTSVTHVSTIVKGTFGYLDPEYYRRHQLTIKSDVFSFGVVLFEVLCARPVIMQQVPKEQVNLAEWARNCYKKGSLAEIVDKNLMGEIAVESLNKFGEIGCSCLSNHGIDRPSMSDVVWSLEFALQLQETYEKLDQQMHLSSDDPTVSPLTGAKDDLAKNYDDLAKNYDDLFTATTVAKASETSATTSDSDGMKSGSVFSEILNPNAR